MAAFERAIQDDTDWVELDVQETADGRVVVIHDSDLMKIGEQVSVTAPLSMAFSYRVNLVVNATTP